MDYEAKLKAAHKELDDKGIWKINYDPPIMQLYRKIGLRFRPCYYQSFLKNFISGSINFVIIYGLLNWLLRLSSEERTISEQVTLILISGVLFGFFMSIYTLVRRKQLMLTDWDSLATEPET